MLSCLTTCIKFYEHERVSPGVMHILKFFRMEKLNVKINLDLKELQEAEDFQEMIPELMMHSQQRGANQHASGPANGQSELVENELLIGIIYEYIWEKQTEIMFRVDWKMQIVSVKHFIDHFTKVLPVFKSSQVSSSSTIGQKIVTLQKLLNEEIGDCIESVAKLAPLVPVFITFTSAEIASASIIVSIKHALKNMEQELSCSATESTTLKRLYSKWSHSIFTRYGIDKGRITGFAKYLKDFLSKVCD